MIDFDKIVKKLGKKGGKIITKDEIFEIVDPEKKPVYQVKLNKIIYRLMAEQHILSLRNGVYVVPDNDDVVLREIDLVEKYFFALLKKMLQQEVGAEYCIVGKKALEFHMRNFEIPQKIFILTRNTNKKIKIGEYTLIFKTSSAILDGKKTNIFQRLKTFSQLLDIEGVSLRIANLELAVFEATTLDTIDGVDVILLNKALKKYAKYFDRNVFEELAKLKYAMALNRLKELSKNIDPKLSEFFLELIKKNGGLFIGEGLRKI